MSKRIKLLIGLSVMPAALVFLLIFCRLFGLLIPFAIPVNSMKPAVSSGDHVIMEGFSYLFRDPRREDIVVFYGVDYPTMLSNVSYDKRIAGEPAEHFQIIDGKLFINSKQVVLSNAEGQISYFLPEQMSFLATNTNLTIPPLNYFLLGDNSTNSLDSRFFGCVPRKNIRGRICFCYWPPSRIGFVK
jgi:signal peptidase I